MGHRVHLQNRDQFIAAIKILNELPGVWHSRGPADAVELLVLDSHYQALLNAGVITANGKESNGRGKEKVAKKSKP